MLREYAAQQDSNIVNAWEEGGEYEGKPVTDEILLSHIKGRRNGLDPSDPLWDRWDQMLDNYSFAIEESKMSLAYAQHSVNDTQMANFYKKWAGKLPTNSEAYRNLMRSAAEFMDAAKQRAAAGGRGGGRRSGGGGRGRSGGDSAAYEAEYMSVYERHERQYDVAGQVLLYAAYREGILQMTDTADPDDLADLRGMDEQDHARFLTLFDKIATDPRYADMRAALEQAGLTGLTFGQFVELGDSKAIGMEQRAGVATRHGDESTAEDIREGLIEFNVQRALDADIDEIAAYQGMRNTLDAALAGPLMTPWQVMKTLNTYGRGLARLDAQATSDQTRGFLNNELSVFRGESVTGPTLYEGNEGGIRNERGSDVANLAFIFNNTARLIAEVESGRAFLTMAPGEAGEPVYTTVPRNTVGLTDQTLGMVVWSDPGGGSTPVPMYVRFNPIHVQGGVGRNSRTGGYQGFTGSTDAEELIGQWYELNGKTYYGIYAEGSQGGDLTWFADDPFNDNPLERRVDAATGVLTITKEVPIPVGATPEIIDALTINPYDVLNPAALDMDLQYSMRFDNPDEATYYASREETLALLRVSPTEAAKVINDMYGSDPRRAAAEMDRFISMRDTAVGLANGRYGVTELERNRLGRAGVMNGEPDVLFENTPLDSGAQARANQRKFGSVTDPDNPNYVSIDPLDQRERAKVMAGIDRALDKQEVLDQPFRPLTPAERFGNSGGGQEIRLPNLPTGISNPHELEYRTPAQVIRPVKTAPPTGPVGRQTGPVPQRRWPLTGPKPIQPAPFQPDPYEPAPQHNEPDIVTPKTPDLPEFSFSSGSGGMNRRPE